MRKEKGRVRFIVLNSIRVLLVIAFFVALYNERRLILIMSALALFLTFLPIIFDRVFKIELPAHFEVIVILFIYGVLLFGEVQGFFAEFWWWSVLINLASAIALGFVGLTVMHTLYKGDKIHASPLVIAFFSFCFAVAVGTVWEFFEFSLDKAFGFNLQESGSTMLDLIANMVGAFVISSAGYFYIKNGRVIIISKLIEKFVEKNPRIFGKESDSSQGILDLIKEGEHKGLEFKSTLRTNLFTNQADKKMEHGVFKTVAAYLNSNGGTLLVGVSDKGEVVGMEKDGFPSNDRLGLHFTNLVKEYIGNEYLPFIKFDIVSVEDKSVLKVDCKKSPKHVFLKTGQDEEFYVRNGPASVKLSGSALVDYINYNFLTK